MNDSLLIGVNHRLIQLNSECPADYYEAGYIRRLADLARKMSQSEADPDRTKVGRHRIIGGYICHNTEAYGPALLTTKQVALKPLLAELCWFLRGETKVQPLNQEGCKIWDEWADEDGNLGLIYGYQWRNMVVFDENTDPNSMQIWESSTVDQVRQALQTIMQSPNDSGNIVSAWNVNDLPRMALRPCHTLWQVCVIDGKLDLTLYQRSADWFLGVPFNAASYTILQCLLAHMTGLKPGKFHHYFGDTHLYDNHRGPTEEYLRRINDQVIKVNRELKLEFKALEQLDSKTVVPLDVLRGIQTHQIQISGYAAEPAIPAPVAV